MRRLPLGGTPDDQAAALLATDPSGARHHAFAEAWVDGRIFDTDGGVLSTGGAPPAGARFGGGDFGQYGAFPFALQQYRLSYPEATAWAAAMSDAEGTGTWSVRRVGGGGVWGSFPARIDAGCEEVEFDLLVTGAAGSLGAEYLVDYTPTEREPEPCDPPPAPTPDEERCFHGRWQLVPSTAFDGETLERMLPSDYPGTFEYLSSTGRAYLTLSTDGQAHYLYNNFAVTFAASSALGPIQITMRMGGESNATYLATDRSLDFEPAPSSVAGSLRMRVPGQGDLMEMPIDLSSVFSTAAQGTATYTCDSDGSLWLDITGPSDATPMYERTRYFPAPETGG